MFPLSRRGEFSISFGFSEPAKEFMAIGAGSFSEVDKIGRHPLGDNAGVDAIIARIIF
jgi:hypothetical protein